MNFLALLRVIEKRPWPFIIAAAAITIAAFVSALGIEIDADVSSLLPENPRYEELQERHGSRAAADFLIVAAQTEDAFTVENLRTYHEFVSEVSEFETITSLTSVFNVQTFRRQGARLSIGFVSPAGELPTNEAEAMELKDALLSDRFSRGLVVSADGNTLVAYFVSDPVEDAVTFMARVREAATELEERFQVYYDGSVPFIDSTENHLTGDFPLLIALAGAFILVFYYLSFRAKRAVLLTLLVVGFGTIWSIGFMQLVGFKISIISILTPPLVLTIGSSYTLHILNQYYREARLRGPDGKPDLSSGSTIAESVDHVTRTVGMAALTTVIGFLSLLATTIGQIRQFGIATTVGIIACALLAVFFLPAALAVIRPPGPEQRKRVRSGLLTIIMARVSIFAVRFRIPIIIATAGAVVATVIVFPQIRTETDYVNYFPNDDYVVESRKFINRTVGNFDVINITVSAPTGGAQEDGDPAQNYFLEQDRLLEVARFEEAVQAIPEVSYLYSFGAYLQFANEVMTGDFRIPPSRGLALLLSRFARELSESYEAYSGLGGVANEDFTEITIAVRYREDANQDGRTFEEIMRALVPEVERAADEHLSSDMTVEIWGRPLEFLRLTETFNRDQRVSMALSTVLVFLMTTIAFRALRFGLLAVVPLIVGLLSNFLAMGVFGIPLDMSTVMVASIAIGVGVDDSIHFLLQYRRQIHAHPRSNKLALMKTLAITGRPILLTTTAIAGGLLILLFANFKPIVFFGLLVAIVLVATAVGTLVLLPALLSFRRPRDGSKHRQPRRGPADPSGSPADST